MRTIYVDEEWMARLSENGKSKQFVSLPESSAFLRSYLANDQDLDDRAVHLLFSANRWESSAAILRTLENGDHIVCDRYSSVFCVGLSCDHIPLSSSLTTRRYSGVAFTAAKGIPNLDLKWCFSPESGLPAPDVVVQLDLPLEVARTRGEYGAERYETDELQEKVRHNFKRLHAAATQNGHKWHVVDASRDIDAVTADVLRIAELTVMEAGFTQLRYFSDSDITTLARLQDETVFSPES